MTDSTANKAIVTRYLEMWNTGDAAVADDILAPDYVDLAHPEVVGPASVQQSLQRIRASIPDFHITVDSLLAEGDAVAVRATIRRTLQGVENISHVAWFVRIIDGKMTELRTHTESAR